MNESVYKVIELVGASSESWERAAAAHSSAARHMIHALPTQQSANATRGGRAMTEQDKRHIEIVRRMYTGDEAERANIARDIVWHVPGHNPVSGDYPGSEAYTKLMPARMAPLTRWDFNLGI